MKKIYYKIKKLEDLETIIKKFPYYFRSWKGKDLFNEINFPIDVGFFESLDKVVRLSQLDKPKKEKFFVCINGFCNFLSKELKK